MLFVLSTLTDFSHSRAHTQTHTHTYTHTDVSLYPTSFAFEPNRHPHEQSFYASHKRQHLQCSNLPSLTEDQVCVSTALRTGRGLKRSYGMWYRLNECDIVCALM
jgi:hypothetical protein